MLPQPIHAVKVATDAIICHCSYLSQGSFVDPDLNVIIVVIGISIKNLVSAICC